MHKFTHTTHPSGSAIMAWPSIMYSPTPDSGTAVFSYESSICRVQLTCPPFIRPISDMAATSGRNICVVLRM